MALAQEVSPTRFDRDYYALQLGNHVLGGGFYATRPCHDLRQQTGYVYSVDDNLVSNKTRSVHVSTSGCDPQNVTKARDLIVRDLHAHETDTVPPEELRQAKALMLCQIPLRESSEAAVAGGLARAQIGLPLDESARAAQRYSSITADEIRTAFAKRIRPEGFVEVIRNDRSAAARPGPAADVSSGRAIGRRNRRTRSRGFDVTARINEAGVAARDQADPIAASRERDRASDARGRATRTSCRRRGCSQRHRRRAVSCWMLSGDEKCVVDDMTPSVLTINGGSSSIRFAVYDAGDTLQRRLARKIDRIGLNGTVSEPAGAPKASRRLPGGDQRTAVAFLLANGVERYGFHGLSYAYLMEELGRLDPDGAKGRVILAHLGNGGGLAAVWDGRSIDTSMGFTPTSGLVMSTRTGDLDPGLLYYLARTERMTAARFQRMVNHESGLLGVSGTSSDVLDLLVREASDAPAAEGVALFCYQAKRWIGSVAAALGGLDTLVFAAGIGEHAPHIRKRICDGLGFLGIELHPTRNAENAAVISSDDSRVTVRVVRTDEDLMIAALVARVLNLGSIGKA